MASPGLAVFVLFFGLALLDALRNGQWLRAGFWIVMGLAFWAIEHRWMQRRRARHPSDR